MPSRDDLNKYLIVRVLTSSIHRVFSNREDIKKYRLSPSELNLLVRALISKYDNNIEIERIHAFHELTINDKKFVICPMFKDAQSENNEGNLTFFLEGVKEYSQTQKHHDYTLLVPMFLCRGFLKAPIDLKLLGYKVFDWFKRKHAVLLEINLIEANIKIHDSQDAELKKYYPDKFAEMLTKLKQIFNKDFKYEWNTYDIQGDDFSCGYFLLEYLEYILQTGNSNACKQIGKDETGQKVGIKIKETYRDKQHFAREKYLTILQYEEALDDSENFEDLLSEFEYCPIEEEFQDSALRDEKIIENKSPLQTCSIFHEINDLEAEHSPDLDLVFSNRKNV